MSWLQEKYIRWVGICLVAAIITMIKPSQVPNSSILYKYFMDWTFTAVYWNGAYLIFKTSRRVYPEISQTAWRIFITLIVLFIWMSVGGIPIKLALGTIDIHEVCNWETYQNYWAMNSLIALIVGTMYETAFFFDRWKETIRQNEELRNLQIRTQFEVLQNQMSPHFLFNSLNTLTTLISENQLLALNFTEKLSDVYRYILQHKECQLVALSEEVQFVKDYVYLLKIRFPENLLVDFKINEKYLKQHIAPLTLQMLLENCIKHNVISKTHPLHVEVYVEANNIVVKNNLKVKQILDKSTQTGLDNIRRRYAYLGNRSIEVSETADSFVVSVPLIEIHQVVDEV